MDRSRVSLYEGVICRALSLSSSSDDDFFSTFSSDKLLATLTTNPKAPFVVRAVQYGSEPLFDQAIAVTSLNNRIKAYKQKLSAQQIPVTISELAYG